MLIMVLSNTCNKEWFSFLKAVLVASTVTARDNGKCSTKGIGSITLVTTGGEMVISDVLYVPSLCKNLLSVRQLVTHRVTILLEDGMVVVCSSDIGNLIA